MVIIILFGAVSCCIGLLCLKSLKIELDWVLAVGIGLLVGWAALALQLALYSLLHIPYNGISLYGPWFFVAVIILIKYVRRVPDYKYFTVNYLNNTGKNKLSKSLSLVEKLLLALLAVILTLILIIEVSTPLNSWDAIATWFLKSKAFYIKGGLDESGLWTGNSTIDHFDYPPLYPLIITALYLSGIGLNEQIALGICFLFIVAGITVMVGFTRRFLPFWACLCLAVLMIAHPYVIAETVERQQGFTDFKLGVIFLGFGISLALWIEKRESEYLAMSLIMGTIAASTKNEGVSFFIIGLVIITISLIKEDRKAYLRFKFWPVWFSIILTVGCIGGWSLYKRFNGYSSDIEPGISFNRFTNLFPERINRIVSIFTGADINLWLILLYLLIATGSILLIYNSRSTLILILELLSLGQMLVYLAIYIITPLPFEWHIVTTWTRLVTHLIPLNILIFALGMANFYYCLKNNQNLLSSTTPDSS